MNKIKVLNVSFLIIPLHPIQLNENLSNSSSFSSKSSSSSSSGSGIGNLPTSISCCFIDQPFNDYHDRRIKCIQKRCHCLIFHKKIRFKKELLHKNDFQILKTLSCDLTGAPFYLLQISYNEINGNHSGCMHMLDKLLFQEYQQQRQQQQPSSSSSSSSSSSPAQQQEKFIFCLTKLTLIDRISKQLATLDANPLPFICYGKKFQLFSTSELHRCGIVDKVIYKKKKKLSNKIDYVTSTGSKSFTFWMSSY